MAAQPQPPRPVQEADAAPDNIEPAALPAAQVPPELRKKFYKTENGSLPLLTQFLNQRPAEDPAILPADIRPDQSAHDFINPLVRPVTPLPPLANFAVAPPQRRPRPGFFRDISLPHPRRIRMPPLVKCFGDRDLRDEAQIFCTANDASKRSRREDKPNNVDVADKAVPGVVIRELRAVDADQRPRCDECRRRHIDQCNHPPPRVVANHPTPDPLKEVQNSEERCRPSDEDEIWHDAQQARPRSEDAGYSVMQRSRPVSRADNLDDRS